MELESRVKEINWVHSIDLGKGVITPGKDDSKYKLLRLALPERFDGKSVLGENDSREKRCCAGRTFFPIRKTGLR